MSRLRFSEAYNEGWDAYINGFTSEANPYPMGTHERDSSDHVLWEDWEKGWGDAWEWWNDDAA